MKLLSYNIEIIHQAGAQNKVPDALSRAFEDQIVAVHQVRDPWYTNKFRMIESNPEKFTDYTLRPNLQIMDDQ